MKKLKIIAMTLGAAIMLNAYLSGCKVSEEIQAKSGAQLWGENCSRCHNVPSPADFSDLSMGVDRIAHENARKPHGS